MITLARVTCMQTPGLGIYNKRRCCKNYLMKQRPYKERNGGYTRIAKVAPRRGEFPAEIVVLNLYIHIELLGLRLLSPVLL